MAWAVINSLGVKVSLSLELVIFFIIIKRWTFYSYKRLNFSVWIEGGIKSKVEWTGN